MRTLFIDILRGIGLLMVILAHVQPCGIVYELRTFDVVLMVFVSGLTFSMKPDFHYWQYLKKRTSRLIIPTYIFLSVYFLLSWVFTGCREPLSNMLLSYTLIGGIGYVWIIRIFLLIMIVAPILNKLTNSLSLALFFVVLITLLIASDSLLAISSHTPFAVQRFLEIILIPTLGYSVPYCVAFRLKQTGNKKEIVTVLAIVLILSGLYFYLHGDSLLINDYKTPPRTLYLAYGMFVSILLYYIVKHFTERLSRIILGGGKWLGQNTIWIYFWHIPFISIVNSNIPYWTLRYICILAISIGLFYLQYAFVQKTSISFFKKYLVG